MVRETPGHRAYRWDACEGRAHRVITYLVGTVGVASIIAVAVIAAQKAGWLDKAQSTVSQIELLSLPSAPQAGLGDVLQGLTGNVRKVEQSTTTLWQRGNEHPRRLNQK